MSLTLYTLAQVRDGTGWPEGSRFLLVLGNPEAAIAAVSCGWTESEEGVWHSSCGGEWLCVPDDRYFRHCPGCGKAIAPTAYVETEEPECPTCGGHGWIRDGETEEMRKCLDCDGTGIACPAYHDPEPADTGGGYEPVDDGDEPEF